MTSLQLVPTPRDTRRAIAPEVLAGVRRRVTVRRRQRVTLPSWVFNQLRAFVEYKAKLQVLPVILEDPRNASRTCPACGCIARANRKTRDRFQCVV